MKSGLLTILFFISCIVSSYSQPAPDNKQVLASVGEHKITLQNFIDRYEDYLIYTGVQDNMRLRFAILNNMVNEILLHNYDDNSEVLNNSEYKKEIRWAKNEVILAFLKDREVYAKITATDAETREAFKRSQEKLAVRHLYAKTKSEADSLYNLLKEGVSFKELAKQVFTDTALKNNGGYLGYITWGDTDPNFENTAYSLKVGEISKPVKTAQGYSIIKLENRISNPLVTENEYDNMKRKIERGVKISKKGPYEKAYLKSIFGDNKIIFSEKILENVYKYFHTTATGDLELDNSSSDLSKVCTEFAGKKYTQAEIERMLEETPDYNLKRLTSVNKVKAAVHGLLMQKKLLSIAHEKGYDTVFDVEDSFEKIANNIYLNFKRNEILDEVEVSDSELYSYYNKNIGCYTSEPEMNVQEIVLQDSSIIALVGKRLKTGGNFASLAKKYSLRKWSAKNGGVMGLAPVSKYGELKDTLWNHPIGKILGPISFDKYFGFFRVLNKQDGKPRDISLVKSQIIKAIKNERGFPVMKKHLDALSKKVEIKINNQLLKNYNLNIAG